MADIPCLSCGKVVWGQHGLSMHTKQWCPNKRSEDEKLLCKYRENIAAKEVEQERLRHLQDEEEAARHREMEERETLHTQWLAEFADLGFDGPDLAENVECRPSGLPKCKHQLPKHYRDELPVAHVPAPVVHIADEWDGPHQDNSLYEETGMMDTGEDEPGSESETPHSSMFCTHHNRYGMFREYQGSFPTYDPESSTHVGQLCDSHNLEAISNNYFKPFLNATVWRLMGWFYGGSNQKSIDDLNNLVHNVILAEDFDCTDLQDFVASQELK
ncbi:hypothetical protein F5141DRAFT_1216779 [Pisolithus sp. B1]|nr:hypothetical protein F5141DRAFT_1216779 [Pisolithus sp. B1]